MIPPPAAWTVDALCTQVDPDLFFPDDAGRVDYRQAKKVCEQCPVRELCLQYALENRIRTGLWGGLTGKQRDELLAHQPRPPLPIKHGTEGGERAHRRRGQQPCDACMKAAARANRERDARRRARQGVAA